MPIKGCGQLVDGVLLYVDGDKPGAMRRLDQVKQANTPADLERFAKTLRETASMPGASAVAAPRNEGADLLATTGTPPLSGASVGGPAQAPTSTRTETPTPTAATSTLVERQRQQPDYAVRALSATTDVTRIISSSFNLSEKTGRVPCKVAGLSAVCFRSLAGPLLVTDVVGATGCPDRLFIGAAKSDTPDFGFGWSFEARDAAVTGARFAVRGGEWLYFAIAPRKKELSESTECQIAWSAFRPWIVPLMTSVDEAPAWR